MTYVGAREETAEQMKSTLAYPDVPEAVAPRFGGLESALESIQQRGRCSVDSGEFDLAS
jgi:hypothetical protein